MRKEQIAKAVKQMIYEAYNETGDGGFDEWDQTFIELLRDDLIQHLNHEGLNILIKCIERNSLSGIKMKR